MGLLSDLGRVERRLGDVDVVVIDQALHVAEEERQQQCPDVGSVDVGVGEDDHLVIARLLDGELLADPGADGGDQ